MTPFLAMIARGEKRLVPDERWIATIVAMMTPEVRWKTFVEPKSNAELTLFLKPAFPIVALMSTD